MIRLFSILVILICTAAQAQIGDDRLYVNRIVFEGADFVDDEVLRRELVQLEGSHINTTALEQSRHRLERLPFVARAVYRRQPVEDIADQIDIVFTITESPAREYRFGGAYSDSLGLSGFGYFVNDNLLGTGQRFFARADVGEYHTAAQVSHTDPYAHFDGVSRTIGLSMRRFDRLTADTTALEGDFVRASLNYRYRIADAQSIRFGVALEDAQWRTGMLASDQIDTWILANGRAVNRTNGLATEAVTAELQFGWHHNTLDRRVFPTTGIEQGLNLNVAVPGSDIEYFTVNYELDKYWSFDNGWVARIGTRLGFGEKYGTNTTSLAPHQHWFAGGPNTVRGYADNRLGPRDSLGNPYGGNLLVAGQFELMMPLPQKWQEHVRLGAFYDIGNVFSTENIAFTDSGGAPVDYDFDMSQLRQSAGIAAQIRLPIGLLRLSYGVPLNANDDHANPFLRDDVDRVQVAIGVQF